MIRLRLRWTGVHLYSTVQYVPALLPPIMILENSAGAAVVSGVGNPNASPGKFAEPGVGNACFI